MSDIIKRLQDREDEIYKSGLENREHLESFVLEMSERRKTHITEYNKMLDILYADMVRCVKESIKTKRRFLFKRVYVVRIRYGNIFDDTPFMFFGELFAEWHIKKWDHFPANDEIYDFVCEIYGKPKYKTLESITFSTKEFEGMWINGVYHMYSE